MCITMNDQFHVIYPFYDIPYVKQHDDIDFNLGKTFLLYNFFIVKLCKELI